MKTSSIKWEWAEKVKRKSGDVKRRRYRVLEDQSGGVKKSRNESKEVPCRIPTQVAAFESGGVMHRISCRTNPDVATPAFDIVNGAPAVFDLAKAGDPDVFLRYLYEVRLGLLDTDKHCSDDAQEIRHQFSNDHVVGAIAYSERVPPLKRDPLPDTLDEFNEFKLNISYKEHHYAIRGDANTLLVVAHGVDLESPPDPTAKQPNRLADYILESPKYAEGDMAGSLLEGYARLREEETIDFTTALVRENKLFIVAAAPASFRLIRRFAGDGAGVQGPRGQVHFLECDRASSADFIKLGRLKETFKVKVTEIELIQGDEMLAILPAFVEIAFDEKYLIYGRMLSGGAKLQDVCEKVVQEAGVPKSFIALLQFPKLMSAPGRLSYDKYYIGKRLFLSPYRVLCVPDRVIYF